MAEGREKKKPHVENKIKNIKYIYKKTTVEINATYSTFYIYIYFFLKNPAATFVGLGHIKKTLWKLYHTHPAATLEIYRFCSIEVEEKGSSNSKEIYP